MDNKKIGQSEYDLERGWKGKFAIFMYAGSVDYEVVLDEAMRIYVEVNNFHEFIAIDNPWTRIIMSDINGMRQRK